MTEQTKHTLRQILLDLKSAELKLADLAVDLTDSERTGVEDAAERAEEAANQLEETLARAEY